MKLLRKLRSHTDGTDAGTAEVHDTIRRVFGDDLVLKEKNNNDGPGQLRVKYVQHLTKNLPRVLETQQQGHKNKWFRSSRNLTQQPEIDDDPMATDTRPGRLGPKIVVFDATAGVGRLVLAGDERVRVEALSNFATARATACVHAGRWMYELHLATGGIMQVGWCTAACDFTADSGVGDTVRSYGYDGGRMRSWNVATRVYGEAWQAGDVIGCLLDLQKGTIHFHRNGRDLGVAFSGVERAPGVAYFPAVSLAMQECVYANFGHVPFVYPVSDYWPMQFAALRECSRASALLRSTTAIVREINAVHTNVTPADTKTWMLNRLRKSHKSEQPASGSTNENRRVEPPAMSRKAFISSLARLTIGLLSPMLRSSYVVVAEFLPHLHNLSLLKYEQYRGEDFVDLYTKLRDHPNVDLVGFLDLLHTFADEANITEALEHCAVRECLIYDQVTEDMTYSRQMKTVYWLCSILQHTTTRQMMLKFVLFGKISFDTFLHLKPPEDDMLARLVRHPWWEKPIPVEGEVEARAAGASKIQNESNPKSDSDMERAYLEDCDMISELIAPLENLQVEYVKTLLENSDGTARIPSTRKLFLGKFRHYIINNCIMDMRMFSVSRPSPPRSLDTFSRLLSALIALWRTDGGVTWGGGRAGVGVLSMPTKAFYDGSFDFYNADRLGGVLAFLVRTLRQELVDVLGEKHPFLMSFEPRHNRGGGIDIGVSVSEAGGMMGPNLATLPQVISSIARFMQTMGPELFPDAMTGGTSVSLKDNSSMSGAAGGVDSRVSLLRMLDGLLALYHHSAAKQMEELSEARDAQSDMSDCLYDLETRLDAVVQEIQAKDEGGNNSSHSGKTEDGVVVTTNKTLLLTIVAELTRSKAIYEEQLRVSSLRAAWTRGAVWTRTRQQQVAVALRAALVTIRDAADPPNIAETVSSKEIFPPKSSLLRYDEEPSYASLDLRYSSSSGQSTDGAGVEILEPSLNIAEELLMERRTSQTTPIPSATEITAPSLSMIPAEGATASGAPPSPELFAFVPHYYIEAALELSNTLRLYMHPTRPCNSLEGWESMLADTASLLCSHISDSRIVISSSREALVQTLASFATHQDTMGAIERVPLVKQMHMIEELLKPYSSRTWAQTNWVLVRFWHGSGFGYRHRQWPHLAAKYGDRVPTVTNLGAKVDAGLMSQCFGPCPSELIQGRISSYLKDHPTAAAAFFHSLLTQINWAFSEFVNMVQELEAASEAVSESRAVKLAATCFDLYHGLTRALELALHADPLALTDNTASDGNADLLLDRTCQTLCGVLARVCARAAGSASFARLASRALPHAERVHHYTALAPIAGCLLEMLKEDIDTEHTGKVTAALVSEPLFRLDAIEFMLGRGNNGAFTFYDYPDDVTQTELASLERACSWLSRAVAARAQSGSSSAGSGSGGASQERLCPICYARPADATFLPCMHHSCKSCIQRHLLNSNQCFFCKAVVEGVREISTEDLITPVAKDAKP